jgi:hypothetical protein
VPATEFYRLPQLFRHFPIQRLHLAGPFTRGKPAISTVASWPGLAQLSSLTLSRGWYHLGPDAAATLARSEYLGGLTELAIHDAPLGARGMAALVASSRLAGLTALSLRGYGFNPEDLGGETGVQQLVASPHLTRLTSLSLATHGVDDNACVALAYSPSLAGLKTLDLPSNEISDEGAETLLRSPNLAGLRRLDLRRNDLTRRMKQALRDRVGVRVLC